MHATYLRIKQIKDETNIVLEHLLNGDVIGTETVSDIVVLISDWRIFRGKTTVPLPGYLVYIFMLFVPRCAWLLQQPLCVCTIVVA